MEDDRWQQDVKKYLRVKGHLAGRKEGVFLCFFLHHLWHFTLPSAATCLSQHLVILDLVTFAPANLPLQRVLVEPATDVDQQGRRTGVDSTAKDHIAHARGHMDTEPQDHTDQ